MLKHCRPDILARGHLSLLQRSSANIHQMIQLLYWYASQCDITSLISKELYTVNNYLHNCCLSNECFESTTHSNHIFWTACLYIQLHTRHCAVPRPRDNRLRHRFYPTPSAGDWPGSSDPCLFSDAFNFHDWGRDLDMQTNDFRGTLRASFFNYLDVIGLVSSLNQFSG